LHRRRGFQTVKAGDRALGGNAQPARLQFLDQTVGLMVGGTDPSGDAFPADLLIDQFGDLGRFIARRCFVDIEKPVRPENALDLSAKTPVTPHTGDRIIPVHEADALVSEFDKTIDHAEKTPSIVNIDHVEPQRSVFIEHGDGGDLPGDHFHGVLGKGVDEDRTPPVSVANLTKDGMSLGRGVEGGWILIAYVDVDMLRISAITNALENIRKRSQRDILGGHADEHPDRQSPAMTRPTDDT
jgi:hypothetical protein